MLWTLKRQLYNVNISFKDTGKPRCEWLVLLGYSLYCGDLEPNPHDLGSMPILEFINDFIMISGHKVNTEMWKIRKG